MQTITPKKRSKRFPLARALIVVHISQNSSLKKVNVALCYQIEMEFLKHIIYLQNCVPKLANLHS